MIEIALIEPGSLPRKYWVKDHLPRVGELVQDARGTSWVVGGVIWKVDGGTGLVPQLMIQDVTEELRKRGLNGP